MHVLLLCFKLVGFHACTVTLLQTSTFPCMYCYFASDQSVSMHVLFLCFRPVGFQACTVTLLQTGWFTCMYRYLASDWSVSMHVLFLCFRPVGFHACTVTLLQTFKHPTLRERLWCDFGYRSNSNGLWHMLKVPFQSWLAIYISALHDISMDIHWFTTLGLWSNGARWRNSARSLLLCTIAFCSTELHP